MKNSHLLYHSLWVGAIAAVVILIAGWIDVKAWVIFFSWANYFLHTCDIKKSFKMLLALSIGIVLAALGVYAMGYLRVVTSPAWALYISAFVVFWIAAILIFLERIENWGQFVPATFLGTVLYFASGASFSTIIPELLVPLLIGIAAGFITVWSRNKLALWLVNKGKT